MPIIVPYIREQAVNYAREWATRRNPRFFNFDKLGGDCTNFASQTLLAGKCIMNHSKNSGWYYINGNNKSPSWTSNNFLHKFLTLNKAHGPFADEVDIDKIEIGDLVQLNFENDFLFNHTLIITSISKPRSYSDILICSHTRDRLDEPLSSINFKKVRFLHILGSYK